MVRKTNDLVEDQAIEKYLGLDLGKKYRKTREKG